MKTGSKVPAVGYNKDLYRTKLCNSVSKGQECKFKEKCFFAHSEKELRAFVRNSHSHPLQTKSHSHEESDGED